MADVNVQAILGNPPPPLNPLQTLSGWQQYANSVQQNRNMQQELANAQLANQTGQQDLATKMAMRHNQIMFGLSKLPDDQLIPAAKQALNDELSTGQIDQQRYDVINGHLQDNAGNPSAVRQTIVSGLVSNLAGPQALAAMAPNVTMHNVGGQDVPLVMPSPVQSLQGQTGVGMTTGGLNRTLPPGYENTGGEIVPVGGALGQPRLTSTLTPGQGTELQPRLVQQPDGSYSIVTQQLQQWNPGLAPAGGKTSLGGGGYPLPAPSSVPMGTEKQLGSDQELYQQDKAAVPALTTGVQSLQKALGALNAVSTGAGTEGLAKMRSYAVSLGRVLGVDTGGVDIQDMNRAELEKYLTDYARMSGTAGRSDEALTAAFKSNASGSINNLAAQDVVRTNIGRDRQKIAAAITQANPQGSGYSAYKGAMANNTDPRGFAWDMYTPQQRAQIVKEVQAKGKDSPEYQKLIAAIGFARQNNLLGTLPQ